MPNKRITVTQETPTGRNSRFHDNETGKDMSRPEFVRAIRDGKYPDYHVRNISRTPTPVSNPDRSVNNNLG